MVDLNAVRNFGEVDADVDPLLDQAFETHAAYISARDHERYVMIGRKGSGKTAIYRQIVGFRSHQVLSHGHGFAEYPWHHHAKQIGVGVPKEQCYLHSWEYLIDITLSKILLTKDTSQPWNDAALEKMARLETFVCDTYGSRNPDLSQVFSPATRLKMKGEVGIDWKFVKAKLVGEEMPIEHLPVVIQDVNRVLSEATIACLNPVLDYYICFDELDLGMSLEAVDYQLRLIGLLLAARKINNKAREAGKKLSVVIFLRDDVYRDLHFEDKNKLTETAVSYIDWDNEKGGPSLKALMEKRFHSVLNIPEADAWGRVFDESQQMTSRQSKYDHIVDRTFLRPRDIIKFSNEILRAHKVNNAEVGAKFINKDIIGARQRYSEYLLDELDDEIRKKYPSYKLYLEVLKTIGSLQFELRDAEAACDARREMLPNSMTATEMLSRLFEYSVVGYYRPGGGGFGGADYVWKYKERRSLFNENATSYRVHPGFMEVLGVKKFTRSS